MEFGTCHWKEKIRVLMLDKQSTIICTMFELILDWQTPKQMFTVFNSIVLIKPKKLNSSFRKSFLPEQIGF